MSLFWSTPISFVLFTVRIILHGRSGGFLRLEFPKASVTMSKDTVWRVLFSPFAILSGVTDMILNVLGFFIKRFGEGALAMHVESVICIGCLSRILWCNGYLNVCRMVLSKEFL